jgi:LacI family transcriptional regulator
MGDLLAQPFPSRGAADALRDRVIVYLRDRRAKPGSPLLTDAQIVERTGLSRSTVRRALDGLQRDGWVSRTPGRGTFAGPRLASADREVDPTRRGKTANALRLGVVLFDIAKLATDWITPHVLAGIDEAAEASGVKVELYGATEPEANAIVRRLERDRPDVLVSLAAKPSDALLLRDAVRLGIPSLVMGTAHQYLGLPAVVEDNLDAARRATRRLLEAGHERVGFVINRWPAGWVFERQEGFEQAMSEANLDVDTPGVCWIGRSDHPGHRDQIVSHREAAFVSQASDEPLTGAVERVEAWLRRHRPTGVVAGSYVGVWALTEAARRLGLSVPRDLSVVAFDPHPQVPEWLGVGEPSLVRLPLRAMGRRIAQVSRALAEGVDPGRVGRVRVAFEDQPGVSVAPPAAWPVKDASVAATSSASPADSQTRLAGGSSDSLVEESK